MSCLIDASEDRPSTMAIRALVIALSLTSTGAVTAEQLAAGEIRKHLRDGLEYVWVEPGSFVMGCAPLDETCQADEKPAREMSLTSGFWMARSEVTVEAFQRFVRDAEYETRAEQVGFGGVLSKTGWENVKGADWRSPGFPQTEHHPVVLVSWYDAQAFCEWSGGRLPTEVEWEYAARGGQQRRRYVWGDVEVPRDGERSYANVADQAASGVSIPIIESEYMDGFAFTSPAGTFEPNHYGLLDMAGNALEWCADSGPEGKRLARGGSWNNPPAFVRVSRRSRFAAQVAMNILGFRCAMDVAPDRSVR